MLPRTEGNAVSAFTLGSHGCWSTAWPRASPFKSGFACTHRSASTTCSGNVAAAKICATNESGYRAIGATSRCSGCRTLFSRPRPAPAFQPAFARDASPAGDLSRATASIDSLLRFRTFSRLRNWLLSQSE